MPYDLTGGRRGVASTFFTKAERIWSQAPQDCKLSFNEGARDAFSAICKYSVVRSQNSGVRRKNGSSDILFCSSWLMIRESLEHDLPEPDFIMRGGEFTITVWRDWLTPEVQAGYNLNERQMKAIEYVKSHKLITNADYQKFVGCPQRTATRDLNELVQKGIVVLEGKGRGAQYRLLRNRAIIAPNAPLENG